MKQRDKWGSLPAGGNITPPEVCNSQNARALGDGVGIADLEANRPQSQRDNGGWLPVTANRSNVTGLQVGLIQQLQHCGSKGLSHDSVKRHGLDESHQAGAARARIDCLIEEGIGELRELSRITLL